VDRVVSFWRSLDDRFQRVTAQPWGAVVTDPRFPEVWDVNYARVERMLPGLTLEAIEAVLEPELGAAGAAHRHLVLFDPEGLRGILTAASARGATLSWDAVMAVGGRRMDRVRSASDPGVEEVRPVDDGFLGEVRASLTEFDVDDPLVASQLIAIEREVLLPAGKRWFRIPDAGRTAALGSILPIGDAALVDHVVTLPFARGRGYASAIVTRMVDAARTAGASGVWLLAEPVGPAERIYRRLGFAHLRTIASVREPRGPERA
jgi:GNAT superfamily N-acetyltransferase